MYWIGNRILSIVFDGKIFNLDSEHFKNVVQSNVGSYTFQEAFDRTGRIINITVAPLNTFDPPRLLNYLTAPHVCVWSAAVASCALPGVFDSSPLIVKEPNGNYRPEHEWGRQGALGGAEVDVSATAGGYSDGSLENDLPMQQLSELFNVNHFIVSQANPHSALLSSLSLRSFGGGSTIYSGLVSYVRFLKAQLRSWLRNFVTFLNFGSDVSPWSVKRGIFQTITQDYEGRESDVTIMPWVGDLDVVTAFLSILKNPTTAEYHRLVAVGEANTWPFISRIRAHCQVEMTLDKCVQRLRKYMSSYRDEKKGMDRTPSFYTSRSIINLSGLSVADPSPSSLHDITSSSVPKKPSREFVRMHSMDNLRRRSNSGSDLNLPSFDAGAIGNNILASTRSNNTSGEGEAMGGLDVDASRSNSNDIDELALTLNVRAADLELASEAPTPPLLVRSRSKEGDPLIRKSTSFERGENTTHASTSSHSSREHLEAPHPNSGIHKTTSMANFYYKRSGQSTDNLSNMK